MSYNSNNSKRNNQAFHKENIIELGLILVMLKKEWKIIVSILFFFTLGTVIYLNLQPKQYQAKTILLPPSKSSINSLNIQEYYEITGEDLYFSLLDNLRSNKLQKEFFTANKTFTNSKSLKKEPPASLKTIYDHGKAGEPRFITVVISGNDPVRIATLVNEYVKFADDRTIAAIRDAIMTKIAVDKNNITRKISSLRQVAEKQKEDNIIRIIEDLKIAQQINMIKPADISVNNYIQNIDNDSFKDQTHVSSPGYLKGTEILMAELNAIKERKYNDPYIQGLDKLLAEKEYLNEILKFDIEKVHSARIDKIAVPPTKHYKPRNFFIIATGVSFGILISIFFVLVRIMYDRNINIRKREEQMNEV